MVNFKPNYPEVSFKSPEWLKVEEWLAGELLETYRRLSGLNVEEKETQQLRGRIALITQMLSFGKLPAAQGPL